MIWSYWSQADLQRALVALDDSLLPDLEEIVPRILPEKFDSESIYSKATLVDIFVSFADSAYFSSRANMSACLERIPEEVLTQLASKLGVNERLSFQGKKEEILRLGWSAEVSCQAFLEHFELPKYFMPERREKLAPIVEHHPPSHTTPLSLSSLYRPLLIYQVDIFFRALEMLKAPKARFIVHMPTGSGKTRTAMEIIAHELNNADENAVVVWLAHSEELCEQAFQCFLEVWPHIGRRPLKACRAWGENAMPASFAGSMFIVAGLQKLWAELRREDLKLHPLAPRTTLLVLDEAHIAVAETYNKALRSLLGGETRVFGLTATPGRADQSEIEDLSKVFFQERLEIPTSPGISVVRELQRRGVLAQLQPDPLYTNVKFELTARERLQLEKDLEFPPGFLQRVGANSTRNLEIIKKLLRECSGEKQVLFFACSVKHSRFICALLRFFGVRAEHIDGTSAKGRRREIVKAFVRGEVQVVCNFGVLTTGFDAPKTDVVFIARPTNSPVLYSQMLGRGMRGPAIGGKAQCKLIDVRDNIEGFGDQQLLYEMFDEYWS